MQELFILFTVTGTWTAVYNVRKPHYININNAHTYTHNCGYIIVYVYACVNYYDEVNCTMYSTNKKVCI